MEVTRRVARELVAEGLAEILQRGKVVDPHKFKGEGSVSSSLLVPTSYFSSRC